MNLLSALSELEKKSVNSGFPCSAGEFLKSLEDKERKAFENALENRTVPIPSLVELLKKNGYTVAVSALYKHRQKGCRCFK
jgi:hypothetical protein